MLLKQGVKHAVFGVMHKVFAISVFLFVLSHCALSDIRDEAAALAYLETVEQGKEMLDSKLIGIERVALFGHS